MSRKPPERPSASPTTPVGAKIEDLPNDKALLTHTVPSEENGEPLETHFWHLAVKSIPKDIVVAVFSLTVPARVRKAPDVAQYIALLDQEIREGPIILDLTDYIR